jgi:hypothetical protein
VSRLSRKCGSLDVSLPVTGIALPLPFQQFAEHTEQGSAEQKFTVGLPDTITMLGFIHGYILIL